MRLAADRGFHTPGPPWSISEKSKPIFRRGALTLIGCFLESPQSDRAVQAGMPMTAKGKTLRGLAGQTVGC